MRLGIFARTFARSNLEETLDAVQAHGLSQVQFNMMCAGLDPLPNTIPPSVCDRVRNAMTARELTMAAVSGTYNMAHPDNSKRQSGAQRLGALAQVCSFLGTSVITLCSGTRDEHNMWRYHPANGTKQAWTDMLGSMESAVTLAEENDVVLVVEPEVSNVVDSAEKAKRMLGEIQSEHLKIVIDAANLFPTGTLDRQQEILDSAFQLLGEHIIMAHAKDLKADGAAGHEAAGTGLLDYDHYIALLRGISFNGPLIMHSLEESQVADATSFLLRRLGATARNTT